jgi:hypothetical protein
MRGVWSYRMLGRDEVGPVCSATFAVASKLIFLLTLLFERLNPPSF